MSCVASSSADGEPGVRDLQAGDTVTELGEHVLRLEPELLEQAGMALGIDLVGQFLFSLVDLVRLALLSEQVEDLVFGDFHEVPLLCGWGRVARCVQSVRERFPALGSERSWTWRPRSASDVPSLSPGASGRRGIAALG